MSVSPEVQSRMVSIDVRGTPVPQGSVSQWKLPNGRTATKYAPGVYKWRAQMQHAIEAAQHPQFTGPVEVLLGFDLARIGSHYLPPNSKRTEPVLRANAPEYPTVAPDIDKLARAVLDSCTDAGLWRDDAQVASLHAAKRYSERPGVLIVVRTLP